MKERFTKFKNDLVKGVKQVGGKISNAYNSLSLEKQFLVDMGFVAAFAIGLGKMAWTNGEKIVQGIDMISEVVNAHIGTILVVSGIPAIAAVLYSILAPIDEKKVKINRKESKDQEEKDLDYVV